jgi:hypothetical protein
MKVQLQSSSFDLCHPQSVAINPKTLTNNWEKGFIFDSAFDMFLNASLIDIKPGVDNLDIHWPTGIPFSCDQLQVTANLMTFVNYSLETSNTSISTPALKDQTTTTVPGLTPCSHYFMEVKSDNQIATLFSKKFKTLKQKGAFEPLKDCKYFDLCLENRFNL